MLTQDERRALFADMREHDVKRFRDGGVEVELSPVTEPTPKNRPAEESEPTGMPTREELAKLRQRIETPETVGPKGTP
jgi:hypothetical protein